MKNSNTAKRLCTLALGFALTSPMAFGTPPPQVVQPDDSMRYGESYAKWSAAWWQWCFSLPQNHHPLFDTAELSAGQSGHVWFLGGSIINVAPLVRSGTIPAGTSLFFPIMNGWADNTGSPNSAYPPTDYSVKELRNTTKGYLVGTTLTCTIDGTPVAGLEDPLKTPYRALSPVFSYTLPDAPNNLINWFLVNFYNDPPPGFYASGATVFPAVADGVYLMVAPLSAGAHTIHFTASGVGASGETIVLQDVTYNLTVQ